MLKKDKYYIRSLHSMTFCCFISGTLITLKSVKKNLKTWQNDIFIVVQGNNILKTSLNPFINLCLDETKFKV